MEKQKSKWKTWEKVVLFSILGLMLLVVIIVNLLISAGERQYEAQLTPKQKDSIALSKITEKGKFEAEVNLRNYVTKRLNDPKSFDVIDQKSWAIDSTIIVMIEYTAKNGFGGVVRNTIKAEADVNGNLTKVFE